ncbi:MAG: hypothetical protein LBU32_17395 [Clostridiales bacterium]|jgi:hypothetical protein|nr:hypothetical protein [Clostridiales bacterium]
MQGPEKDVTTAQASIICDIYSQVAAGAEIDPLPADGRTMAERRLDSLSEKGRSAREPFIFDRGCPPFDPMHKLETLGSACAMRAPKSFNQDAAARKEGGGRILLKRAGSDGMAARILKFDLESGGREIPSASLFDGRMGIKAFKEPHSCAGGVEGGHRPVKSKLQLESFSCKAEFPIRRDFIAVAYMDSLASADCRGRRRSRRRRGPAKTTGICGEPTKRSPYRSFRAISSAFSGRRLPGWPGKRRK